VTAVASDFIFTDASMDFDLNDYLLPGVTAQVTFNSGQLAGYTFDVATYDNATKTFTINANTQEQTLVIPSDALKPAIGDSYVIVNISMPLAYVNDAEALLLAYAQNYLDNNSAPKVTYAVECNPLYFKAQGLQLTLGYLYQLLDTDMDIDRAIRLTAFTRNIRRPEIYTVELSDTVPVKPAIVKLFNQL